MRKFMRRLFKPKALWIALPMVLFVGFYVLYLIFDSGDTEDFYFWHVWTAIIAPVTAVVFSGLVYGIFAVQALIPVWNEVLFSCGELFALVFSFFLMFERGIDFLLHLSDGFTVTLCIFCVVPMAIFFADLTWQRLRDVKKEKKGVSEPQNISNDSQQNPNDPPS